MSACDEEQGLTREECGHQVAYQGDLDGYPASIRVVDNTNYDRYTVDIYIGHPNGGGVSKATVEMQHCGEIFATVKGSAGTYEVAALLTADSASGAWSHGELGTSGDWLAEVEQR
ncbi:MAG: hypothetical protein AAF721_21370 [Myxococcota bacterium]